MQPFAAAACEPTRSAAPSSGRASSFDFRLMVRDMLLPLDSQSGWRGFTRWHMIPWDGNFTVRAWIMCRNIRTLFNFEPPATEAEIRAASLQFVRKLSGFNAPSKTNQAAFDRAIEEVAAAATTLIRSLVTTAEPRDREVEAERARARSRMRFAPIK